MGNVDEITPDEWLAELFKYENCSECGEGVDNHGVIILEGNYFAKCIKEVK